MSYWKENRYYKDNQMANAATESLELPEKGLLSAIRLQMYATNAGAIHAANKARIIDRITKIEVTNGADKTMFSMRGQQVKALNFYDMGKVPYEKAILYGAQTQRTDLIIPFGRYWKDRDYMIDLSKYDSAYLDITNDAGTTQWATNALKANVNLLTLEEEAAAPAKYIKNYEWRSGKPSAAGQHVYHDLPTTEMIKRVMVQLDPDLETAGNATSDPKGDSLALKYTYLQEKEVLLDHRPRDIARMNAFDYGLARTNGRYAQSTSQYIDVAIMDVTNEHFAVMGSTASTVATAEAVMEESNDRFQKMKNVSAGATAPEFIDLEAVGVGYYHTLILEDHVGQPEAEWLNPTKETGGKGPVRIDWNGYTADHTVRTCLQVPIEQGAF